MSNVLAGCDRICVRNIAKVATNHLHSRLLACGLQREHSCPPMDQIIVLSAQNIYMDRRALRQNPLESTREPNDRNKTAVVVSATVFKVGDMTCLFDVRPNRCQFS